MKMLVFERTTDRVARGDSVRWYEHVLRKDKRNAQRRGPVVKVNRSSKWSRKVGLRNGSDYNNNNNNQHNRQLGVNII